MVGLCGLSAVSYFTFRNQQIEPSNDNQAVDNMDLLDVEDEAEELTELDEAEIDAEETTELKSNYRHLCNTYLLSDVIRIY